MPSLSLLLYNVNLNQANHTHNTNRHILRFCGTTFVKTAVCWKVHNLLLFFMHELRNQHVSTGLFLSAE